MPSQEIIMLVALTAKKGKEEKLRELAAGLNRSTNSKDKGCVYYYFHQRVDNPREFIIYERWRDQAALEAHIARLNEIYGTPAPGELFPPAMLELIEKSEMSGLQIVE